jgi:hypothetical protein
MHESSTPVNRANPRFSFVANAEATGLRDGTRIVARVSQLSARGCYVDTLDPFPIGTAVLLRIRYGSSTCEVPGKVAYTHSSCGMGVVFDNLAVEQRSTIDSWLSELARKSRSSTR